MRDKLQASSRCPILLNEYAVDQWFQKFTGSDTDQSPVTVQMRENLESALPGSATSEL